MSDNINSSRTNTPPKSIIQQLLTTTLNKLNLVTRQEFAIQTQVLIKTRLRVEQLENKLRELEAHKQPP